MKQLQRNQLTTCVMGKDPAAREAAGKFMVAPGQHLDVLSLGGRWGYSMLGLRGKSCTKA